MFIISTKLQKTFRDCLSSLYLDWHRSNYKKDFIALKDLSTGSGADFYQLALLYFGDYRPAMVKAGFKLKKRMNILKIVLREINRGETTPDEIYEYLNYIYKQLLSIEQKEKS